MMGTAYLRNLAHRIVLNPVLPPHAFPVSQGLAGMPYRA